MQPRPPYPGIGHALLMCLGMLLLSGALAAPFMLLETWTQQAFGSTFGSFHDHPAFHGGVNLLSMGAIVWWGYAANQVSWRHLLPFTRVPLQSHGAVVVASLGLCVVLSELDNLLREVVPMSEAFRLMMEQMLAVDEHPWATAFLLIVVAPLTEEPLFRGVILRGLAARHRPWVAIVVSSVLFGFVHLNPWQFVAATCLGLMYGWWYLRTRSLWPGIIGHAVNNGLAFLFLMLAPDLPAFAGGVTDEEVVHLPLWLTLAGAGVAAAGGWWFVRATRDFKPDVLQPPPLPPGASSAIAPDDAAAMAPLPPEHIPSAMPLPPPLPPTATGESA